jgi:seryl-tRNA synthetase
MPGPTSREATFGGTVIDIRLVRDQTDFVVSALGRRGVDPAAISELLDRDAEARDASGRRDALRAEVNELSRRVAEARRRDRQEPTSTGTSSGVSSLEVEEMMSRSRELGDQVRDAEREAASAAEQVRAILLDLPNIPSPEAPDGAGPEDNVVVARWPEEPRTYADHQRVPHWEVGASLGILDMERGAKLSGSMFPCYRGLGARLLRGLAAFALDSHSDAWEEVRPPTLVLTETMTSTGHLPKFSEEAYHVERDDLWAIPTAEVPLASMYRNEILEQADLPQQFTAYTACYRREAGAAGRDTRGLLRVHEFDKVELFAFATADQSEAIHQDMLARARSILRALDLEHRVLDLCTGDMGISAARTYDLEVYAPGADMWLEVSSVSWCSDYQARRANVRYRPSEGGTPVLAHTLNGSALAWARIWAALVECGRTPDGGLRLPSALGPYLGDLTLASK